MQLFYCLESPFELISQLREFLLFFGNFSLLGIQALSVVSAWVYSFVVTLIILKVLAWTMGLRVTDEHEVTGLDLSQHGESGYAL
jgi:Amt family ammonium transporter